MNQINFKALSPPAPAHFKEVSLFLTGGHGTYFPHPQTLHCQTIKQDWDVKTLPKHESWVLII